MLNVRIRKAYLNNNTKIISLNEIGDLTYPYVSLDGKTQTLRDIIENKNDDLIFPTFIFFFINTF